MTRWRPRAVFRPKCSTSCCTGYPNGLSGKQISDIVRLTTIVDIYAALVEKRAYRLQFTHARAFGMMEEMGDKLDQHLLHAFRPVAFGYY